MGNYSVMIETFLDVFCLIKFLLNDTLLSKTNTLFVSNCVELNKL